MSDFAQGFLSLLAVAPADVQNRALYEYLIRQTAMLLIAGQYLPA